MMLNRIKAYYLGMKDGMNPPFSTGMSYNNYRLNESYDAGINVGEIIYEIRKHVKRIKRHPKSYLP